MRRTFPSAVKKDLEDLERLLRPRIQAKIFDEEKKEDVDWSTSHLLSELRELDRGAEDVLDEWSYELLRAEVEGGAHQRKYGEGSEQALRLLRDDAPFRDRVAAQIGRIRGRFYEISGDCRALQLRSAEGARRRGLDSPASPAPSSSLVDDRSVFDMDGYKDMLVNYMLSGKCAGSSLSVIPIVGTALAGKTTLAQLIVNDPRVLRHFSVPRWLSLTRDSDLRSILQRLAESLTSEPCRWSQLEAIQKILKQCLTDNRFLLVLDDVHRDHLCFWDRLKPSIDFGLQGSVVLITTQSAAVARTMQTVPALYLDKQMSDEDCWSLFKNCAFDGRDTSEGWDMTGLHNKVVEICQGVPLLAKLLGFYFRTHYDRDTLMDFMENSVEHLVKREILPALGSRFRLLPAHLKPCLLYCSLFPKGYLLSKDQLVRFWIAQGFVPSNNQNCPEDIGIRYFNELLSRSFFLQSEDNEEEYYMPNIICDLVYSISEDTHSRVEDICNLPEKTCHLSLICKSMVQCESFYTYSKLRSFLVLQKFPYTSLINLQIHDKMFHELKHLRSLDLSYTNTRTLPDSIGDLKHLRLLALNHTKIMRLPESIHKLYNLQILELKNCSCLQELPRGISSLVNLQHLDVDSAYLFVHKPLQIQKLTRLQKLPTFNILKGTDFYGIRELRDLTNLRELGISGLCNVMSLDDADEANMRNKKYLKTLKLIWPSIDAAQKSEPFDDCEHQNSSNSADETDEEVEQNVCEEKNPRGSVDEQQSDYVKPFSCGIDDKPERLVDFVDEQDSNFSVIRLRDGVNKVGIQDSVSSDTTVSEEDLLKSLHPFTNLEELFMKSYGGHKFPKWIGDSSFSKLIYVEFQDCKCAELPPLGQLPYLKFLSIDRMSVVLVGIEFCGRANATAFPELETLSFHNMNKWESWDRVKEGDFPKLQKLSLFNCPELRRVPNLF